MSLIIPANSLAGGGYAVDNSLRFNRASSDYLNKTLGTPTNNKIWTLSFWIKRSGLGVTQGIFSSGSTTGYMYFPAGDQLQIEQYTGAPQYSIMTNRVFRDTSAWYHIVVAMDTTQATASDRIKLYVNGVQETDIYTGYLYYPALNLNTNINSAVSHVIGALTTSNNINAYMSETYFIDGQALTPTDFGEFDADSGVWKPIAYSGTYGTNGFFLEFQDSGALGTDSSGNANTFTVNNLTSIDQTTDTPTNNFATMNPLTSYGSVTLAEGNTQVNVADNTDNCTSTFMVSSGKWYWEGKYTVGASSLAMVGIRPEGMNYNQINLFNLTGTNQGYYYYANSGNQRPANTSYGATYAVNDIIGFALDLDSGTQTITFYKNGASQGAITIATSGLTWGFSYTSGGGSDTFQMNFGNPPFTISSGNADANGYGNFEYAVPSGYLSLCTKNLSEVNS